MGSSGLPNRVNQEAKLRSMDQGRGIHEGFGLVSRTQSLRASCPANAVAKDLRGRSVSQACSSICGKEH